MFSLESSGGRNLRGIEDHSWETDVKSEVVVVVCTFVVCELKGFKIFNNEQPLEDIYYSYLKLL